MMRLNEDLSARAIVHAGALDWVPSPAQGVERRMLFRIGDERARATSIVRYAPGSRFARHSHPGGEEILVLEGEFQDESGDFPAGSYVRNPPGTAHAPGSAQGCIILVKLWQFARGDTEPVVRHPGEGQAVAVRPGVTAARLLFAGAGERVLIEDWAPDARVEVADPRGLELFVLEGAVREGADLLERWSWLRVPPGPPLRLRTGDRGARVWYKSAPPLHPDVCAFA